MLEPIQSVLIFRSNRRPNADGKCHTLAQDVRNLAKILWTILIHDNLSVILGQNNCVLHKFTFVVIDELDFDIKFVQGIDSVIVAWSVMILIGEICEYVNMTLTRKPHIIANHMLDGFNYTCKPQWKPGSH